MSDPAVRSSSPSRPTHLLDLTARAGDTKEIPFSLDPRAVAQPCLYNRRKGALNYCAVKLEFKWIPELQWKQLKSCIGWFDLRGNGIWTRQSSSRAHACVGILAEQNFYFLPNQHKSL